MGKTAILAVAAVVISLATAAPPAWTVTLGKIEYGCHHEYATTSPQLEYAIAAPAAADGSPYGQAPHRRGTPASYRPPDEAGVLSLPCGSGNA